MAPEPDHLFTYVAAIGKISNFLGQPRGIDLYHLSIPTQQLSYSLLQAGSISIHQPGGGALNRGNQRINPFDTFSHLQTKCLSFLRAHAFEFVEGLGQSLFNSGYYIVAQRISSGLKSTWQPREHVNVQFAGNTKLLLHLAQRIDVTGNQRSIQLIGRLRSLLEVDGNINPST